MSFHGMPHTYIYILSQSEEEKEKENQTLGVVFGSRVVPETASPMNIPRCDAHSLSHSPIPPPIWEGFPFFCLQTS